MESIQIQSLEAHADKRRICRRTDIVRMFFGIANAIRLSGRDMFFTPIAGGGAQYTFAIGNRRMTYTVQEGGAL